MRKILLRVLPVNSLDQFLGDGLVHRRIFARIQFHQACHRLVVAIFVQSAKVTLHDVFRDVRVLDQKIAVRHQTIDDVAGESGAINHNIHSLIGQNLGDIGLPNYENFTRVFSRLSISLVHVSRISSHREGFGRQLIERKSAHHNPCECLTGTVRRDYKPYIRVVQRIDVADGGLVSQHRIGTAGFVDQGNNRRGKFTRFCRRLNQGVDREGSHLDLPFAQILKPLRVVRSIVQQFQLDSLASQQVRKCFASQDGVAGKGIECDRDLVLVRQIALGRLNRSLLGLLFCSLFSRFAHRRHQHAPGGSADRENDQPDHADDKQLSLTQCFADLFVTKFTACSQN